MIYVVDASVAAKWFLGFRETEPHTDEALAILSALVDGTVVLHQPPHFIAEMCAILAREKPEEADADLANLFDLEFEVISGPEIYATACELAIRLDHHVFDTLYHAVALHVPDAVLVTADRRYLSKARMIGSIAGLDEVPR